MAARDSSLFRKTALDRLASPERLDERPRVPAYPRPLLAAALVLVACAAAFAAWLG
jgi:hypothetical protein